MLPAQCADLQRYGLLVISRDARVEAGAKHFPRSSLYRSNRDFRDLVRAEVGVRIDRSFAVVDSNACWHHSGHIGPSPGVVSVESQGAS